MDHKRDEQTNEQSQSRVVNLRFLIKQVCLEIKIFPFLRGISDSANVIAWVSVCVGVGWEWGETGGWMPQPTCPQRYCDPASLDFFSFIMLNHLIIAFSSS